MNPSDHDRSSSHRSESNAGGSPEPAAMDPKTRIRQKLLQVRREAEVARLEANAARLEASAEHLEEMLERVDAGHALTSGELSKLGLPGHTDAPPDRESESPVNAPETLPKPAAPDAPKSPDSPQAPESPAQRHRFQSWDDIRKARLVSASKIATAIQSPTKTVEPPHQPGQITRADSPHASVATPKMRGRNTIELPAPKAPSPKRPDESQLENDESDSVAESNGTANSVPENKPKSIVGLDHTPDAPIDLENDAEPENRRRHPMALVVSALIHTIVFMALAGFTLTTTMPKDQVALSASVSESSESAFETFQIESVEPMLEPTETTPAETQYDVSPLGEMAAVDVTSDVIASISQPIAATSSLAQPMFNDSAKLESLKSDSKSKMEFCGVEGGGNHFVYLVDSSGSMGDAFTSARRALLESIDMLGSEQRFYVIFFDAQCDYMRINRADEDEPRSVYATPENKQKLKSWAMRVSMDRGKAPYEPLEYALTKLRPDVIFLLSDGEFPQGIEDLVSETNQVSNLFGDESPISIIHTISYHSREGEARMRRIAEKNYGQYRHVAKPSPR